MFFPYLGVLFLYPCNKVGSIYIIYSKLYNIFITWCKHLKFSNYPSYLLLPVFSDFQSSSISPILSIIPEIPTIQVEFGLFFLFYRFMRNHVIICFENIVSYVQTILAISLVSSKINLVYLQFLFNYCIGIMSLRDILAKLLKNVWVESIFAINLITLNLKYNAHTMVPLIMEW